MFDQNNKLTKQFEDTIDIADILNTIWEGKFKIIFIVLASIIIGAIYNYQKPELYKVSLDIRKGKDTEFIKFLPINKFFNEYELNEIIEITDQKFT